MTSKNDLLKMINSFLRLLVVPEIGIKVQQVIFPTGRRSLFGLDVTMRGTNRKIMSALLKGNEVISSTGSSETDRLATRINVDKNEYVEFVSFMIFSFFRKTNSFPTLWRQSKISDKGATITDWILTNRGFNELVDDFGKQRESLNKALRPGIISRLRRR